MSLLKYKGSELVILKHTYVATNVLPIGCLNTVFTKPIYN